MSRLDARVPEGPIESKWKNHQFNLKLVNPANKRKYTVIVVGTGLAGASAAATMSELGYNVISICMQDSPRRAHSIAAQGGINAAKNYPGDGDSVFRLFYDTIKGGDFRSRESNVYRLAEISNQIIDHCVAQGVPFAREYGGYLSNRSFGGAQVSRTFYAKGQTGQQLLLGAYGALMKEVESGNVTLLPRRELMELVLENGDAKGVIVRNLLTGDMERYGADAVVLATGGYSNAFYLSTNAIPSNVTATWRAHKKGAFFANPCYTQIHPTCLPVHGEFQSKLTLMSESLRNDGRVWVPKTAGDKRRPVDIPESERDYFLERKYPSFGNLVPRDLASRNAKTVVDEGRGAEGGEAVFLDFQDAIKRLGENTIFQRYGNLFEMYNRITGDDPFKTPMKIYPAPHYTMGGLWVDYNLMSTIPGLFVAGEANFSDHGANRLGASALMQGLADGYFILPRTIAHYLAEKGPQKVDTTSGVFMEAEQAASDKIEKLLNINGTRTVDSFHRELGRLMWDKCGMSRSEAGLKEALLKIAEIRDAFWSDCKVAGVENDLNQVLEKAGRVADYLEFAELMVTDALNRGESCGGHFREESQTEEGEALRNDDEFSYVAAWEFTGVGKAPVLHQEALSFSAVHLAQRSYK